MDFFENFSFADPWWLLGLALVPALVLYEFQYKSQRQPAFRLPALHGVGYGSSWRMVIRRFLPILRFTAVAIIFIVLARPQSKFKTESVTSEGIDIVSVLDISSSMLTPDFSPNRLEAAKEVLGDFIDNRPNDRVGLVVFTEESLTLCPITSDHRMLKDILKEVRSGMLSKDNTAIGRGLATGVDRLRESEAISKVIILLTDGVNTANGLIDPYTASEMAKKSGIRVYTIGMGRQIGDPRMNLQPMVQLDEKLLGEIASGTGGRYFRATDNQKLGDIYEAIDRLEKTKLQSSTLRHNADDYYNILLTAIALLILEMFVRYTLVKTIA